MAKFKHGCKGVAFDQELSISGKNALTVEVFLKNHQKAYVEVTSKLIKF